MKRVNLKSYISPRYCRNMTFMAVLRFNCVVTASQYRYRSDITTSQKTQAFQKCPYWNTPGCLCSPGRLLLPEI